MDVRSCPVDECVEIQLESLQVPRGGGHRDISSQRSAACDARPRDGRSAGVDHVLGDEWLNTQAGAHRRRDTSPARQPLPETSLGPRAADSCRAILTAAGRLRGSCRSAAPSCPRPRGSVPNPVHPRMTACAPRRTRSAIAALNFTLVAGRETWPWKGLLTGSPCTFSWCSPWRPGRSSRSAPADGRGARCAWSRPSRRAQRPPVSPVRRARDRARHRPRGSPR